MLNWETAFHRSFHRHFPRTLDLEKWWMVTLIGFTGHDPTQAWAPEICLERLNEILLIPAQVRVAPDIMPVRTYVTPQQIIADWDFRAQKPALSQAVVQLTALRSNCPLAVAALVEGYRFAFQDYLQKRVEAVSTSTSRRRRRYSIPWRSARRSSGSTSCIANAKRCGVRWPRPIQAARSLKVRLHHPAARLTPCRPKI